MGTRSTEQNKPGFLPREGFYVDPFVVLLRKTIWNPYIVVPLALLIRGLALPQASERFPHIVEAAEAARVFCAGRYIQWAAIWGFWLNLNDYLSKWSRNNWTTAKPWNDNTEIAVVTGGCSGIGASVVERLAQRTAKVVVLDISAPPAGAQNDKVKYYRVDLSNSEEIRKICETIKREVGNPTVLINNAGLARGATIAEGSYHDPTITLQTNLLAPFLLTKELLPHMIKHDHGHILSISSFSAYVPPAQLADYAASKAGLIAFHEALDLELKFRHNAPRVRSSIAVLSFVKTPMFDGKTNQSEFVMPLMHVDTIGDAITNQLYSGLGKMMFYPGIFKFLTWIRGSPEWVQRGIRTGTEELSVNFVGRQTIDSKTGKLKA